MHLFVIAWWHDGVPVCNGNISEEFVHQLSEMPAYTALSSCAVCQCLEAI